METIMNHQTTAETTPVQHTRDPIARLWCIVGSANRSDIKFAHALIRKMTGSGYGPARQESGWLGLQVLARGNQ